MTKKQQMKNSIKLIEKYYGKVLDYVSDGDYSYCIILYHGDPDKNIEPYLENINIYAILNNLYLCDYDCLYKIF